MSEIEPGQRFGWLTVIRAASPDPVRNRPRWLCRCGCGKELTPRADQLKSGQSTSCGCRRWVKGFAASAQVLKKHAKDQS